jgi:hypothetical protein
MKQILVFLVLSCNSIGIICQVTNEDQQNLEKYWKYRDRLNTYFMKIGSGDGQSIPMSCRIPGWDAAGGYETIDIPHEDVTTLEWKDATISLGYFFIVLDTEFKLLSKSGQNVQSTLNELYYAMQAFNRIDMTAEGYLAGNPTAESNPEDLNGFFLRDGVRHEMALNFANDLPFPNGPIQPDPGHPNQMRADFEGWTNRQEIFLCS